MKRDDELQTSMRDHIRLISSLAKTEIASLAEEGADGVPFRSTLKNELLQKLQEISAINMQQPSRQMPPENIFVVCLLLHYSRN